jgi:site-specific recombinase XerD
MKNQEYLEVVEGLGEWMERLNYAKGSVRSRQRQIKLFLEFMESKGRENLEEITKEDLDSYNAYLHARPIGMRTIEGYISALKLLNQYRELYGLPPVMSKRLRITKSVEIERVVLSEAEIKQLYDCCKDDVYGCRDRVILALYYGCGLRYREGAHVEQRDVNFSSGLLHVRKGKNYRERYVPMSKGVMEELRRWIAHYRGLFTNQTNLLISSRSGKKIRSNALNTRLGKLLAEARIEKRITLHGLRHSIATHLMEKGMKLEDVGQFLGHVTLETTQIYVHVVEEI